MNFFDLGNTAFELWGYPLSWLELVGTLFGLVSVWLAGRAHIGTWPTGIVNEVCLFALFYQVQLYADMALQVYFFGVTLYGWYHWKARPGTKPIGTLSQRWRLIYLLLLAAGTMLAGPFFGNIHLYWPQWFTTPAAYPYWDTFVMVASILATVLLARKRIETWYLWLAVDVVCIVLFALKGVYFLAAEYVVFLVLAAAGLQRWRTQQSNGS